MDNVCVERAMASKQQQRSEASYEALIRAAIRQFHEHGYAATSVDDIVRRTDYSRGSFYFHFTNKLDCFWHVIAYRQKLRAEWAELPSRRDPRTTSLHQILREAGTSLTSSLEGMEGMVLLMVECHQQTRHDEDAQRRLHEIYPPWLEEIATFVRGLQEGGWVDPAIDTQVLAARMFAFVEGVSVHQRLYELGGINLGDVLIGGLLGLLPPPPEAATA